MAVRGAVVAAALLAALPSAGGTLPEARGRATGFFSEPNAARAARPQEGGAEILLEVTLLSGVTVEVGGGGPPGEADGHEVSGGACSPPGEVQGLLFVDGQTLSWSPPADPGVPPAVLYDTLRTTQASDFTDNFSATCIESDGGDQTTTEAGNPPLGRAFFYQVGAKNPCGEGSLGTASNGGARQARSCSGGNGGLEAPNGAGWPSDRPNIARHPTAKNAGTVYLHSGEYHLEQVDLRIPGRGLDFEWRRTYRSREGRLTNMGQGWDFSYNRRVELSGDDPADRWVHDGGSRRDTYRPAGNDCWTAEGFFRELCLQPDGSYVLTFPDTTTWWFAALDGSPAGGRIIAIRDRNQNRMAFAYDGLGRLVTITDTLDRPIQVSYNAEGFISAVTDFAGRQVQYGYYQEADPGGSFGDLRSWTSPAVTGTPNGNDYPAGKTVTYTYARGFSEEARNHNLLTITDPAGQALLENAYATAQDPQDPSFDRLERQSFPNGVIDFVYVQQTPASGNNLATTKTIVNDRRGHVREAFFNARNQLVLLREFTGTAADPGSPTNDLFNRPAGRLRPDDPAWFETRYEYNADSLRTRTVHPNSNSVVRVFETDLDPAAPRRSQGNLRELRRLPGTHTPVGDQPEIVELFEYELSTNFVNRYTDPRGNVTQHVYDAAGNRLQILHPLPGVVEDWTYNSFGQMTSHTLPDRDDGYRRRDEYRYYSIGPQTGYLEEVVVDAATLALTTRFEYDLVGNKVREIDPLQHDWLYAVNSLNQVVLELWPEVTPGGVRYERRFWFDANDNLARVDVENRDENGVLQANSHFTTIHEFDLLNHVVRTCRESGIFAVPPAQMNCTGLPQSEFVVEEFVYDPNRNQVLERKGEATNGKDPYNTVSWAWDERDMLFREISAAGSDLQSTTQHDYDGNANERATHEGLESGAHVTTRIFDAYDRKVSETDSMRNVTEHHYDPSGNLGGLASPGVPNPFGTRVMGELVDVPDSAGNVRLYESDAIWDPLNRLLAEVVEHFDPFTQAPIGDGQSVTTYVWSPASLLQATIDDHGHPVATLTYDTVYRRETVVDAATNTTVIGYDPDSRIVSWTQTEKSSLGGDVTFVTTWTWDGLHRWTSTTDSVGTTELRAYDSRGNLLLSQDGKGNETRSVFDGLNRMTEQRLVLTDTGEGGGTVIGEIVTTQVWDDSSRLESRTDGNGHTTQYVHDSLDRRTATLLADCTQHQVLQYDAHDQPLQTQDANGTILTQTFDQLDRLVMRQIQVADCQPPPGACVSPDPVFENFAHDGLSRLVHAGDSDALVDFAYDSLSRKIRETLNGRTTTCSFDGGGRRLSCTYPGGQEINYTHNVLDRVTSISDSSGTVASFWYVGPMRIERRTYGNGTMTDYTYDGVLPNPPGDFGERQIVRMNHYRLSGQQQVVLDERTYTWDRMDNWTQRENVHPSVPGLTHAYTLDSAYRPVRTLVTDPVDSVVRDTHYAHDDVGNRTFVSGDECPGAYTCDPTLCEPADCQVHHYTQTPCNLRHYDPNGNLVEALVNSAQPVIAHYDYANRLVDAFVSLNGQTHQYRYDPLGRRIAKIANAGGAPVETRFFYLDGDVIEEQDGSGATTATYLWDDRGPVQMVRGAARYWYHEDAMGSVMAVTNASGFCVERYDYADYGNPSFLDPNWNLLPGSVIQNPLLFHGWRWDDELQLYYAGGNFDPVAGRPIIRGWSDPGAAGTGSFLTEFETLWARMTVHDGFPNLSLDRQDILLPYTDSDLGIQQSPCEWSVASFLPDEDCRGSKKTIQKYGRAGFHSIDNVVDAPDTIIEAINVNLKQVQNAQIVERAQENAREEALKECQDFCKDKKCEDGRWCKGKVDQGSFGEKAEVNKGGSAMRRSGRGMEAPKDPSEFAFVLRVDGKFECTCHCQRTLWQRLWDQLPF